MEEGLDPARIPQDSLTMSEHLSGFGSQEVENAAAELFKHVFYAVLSCKFNQTVQINENVQLMTLSQN